MNAPTAHLSQRQESSQAKAERMLDEKLKRRGWNGDELGILEKGSREKLQIARRLRQQTTMI